LKINLSSQEQFQTKDNHVNSISPIRSDFDKITKTVPLIEKPDKQFLQRLLKVYLSF